MASEDPEAEFEAQDRELTEAIATYDRKINDFRRINERLDALETGVAKLLPKRDG